MASGNPRVHENVNGAVVGEVSVTDQDTWQSHSCQLTDSADGRFVMVGREVRVSSNANLDYESQQQHTITVQCTDDGTPPLSVTKSFTVKVLDVNEKPQAIHISHDTVAIIPILICFIYILGMSVVLYFLDTGKCKVHARCGSTVSIGSRQFTLY